MPLPRVAICAVARTPIGKFIGALTALMGVCTVALLTGIVH